MASWDAYVASWFAVARGLQRDDLAALSEHPAAERFETAKAVTQAIDALKSSPMPEAHIGDDVGWWFPAQTLVALRAHGIGMLADRAVWVPRRRQRWKTVPRLGLATAWQIEGPFALRGTPARSMPTTITQPRRPGCRGTNRARRGARTARKRSG